MFRPGTPELLIILGIVVLILGVGRIGKLGGEIGKGIKSFKDGLSGASDKEETTKEEEKKS